MMVGMDVHLAFTCRHDAGIVVGEVILNTKN
jgi:hypothetical protein